MSDAQVEEVVDTVPEIDWDSESKSSEIACTDKYDFPTESSDAENKIEVDDEKNKEKVEDVNMSLVPYYRSFSEETTTGADKFTDWIVDVCLLGRRNSILGRKKFALKDRRLENLEMAVARGRIPDVRKILAETTGSIPVSVVLMALTSGQPETAEVLLESDRVISRETSPLLLYIAMQPRSSLWEAELRVAHLLNADPNVVGDKGESPIYEAVKNGNVNLARYLLEDLGADLQPSPGVAGTPESMLYYAVKGDQGEEMVELLSGYINLGMVCYSDNTNALHWLTASRSKPAGDRVPVAQLLLDHGASLDQQNSSGLSPLHQAVKIDSLELVSLFLEHGGNVNQESWLNGTFPLYFAAELEDPSPMISLLAERGANINMTTTIGRTALHRACELFNEEAIRSLLENGADVNAADISGKTPLKMMDQAYGTNFESVKPVLEAIAKSEFEKRPVNFVDLETIDGILVMQDYFEECREKFSGKRNAFSKLKRRLYLIAGARRSRFDPNISSRQDYDSARIENSVLIIFTIIAYLCIACDVTSYILNF